MKYRFDNLGFCYTDFVTSTKTNLEVKIDLSASFARKTSFQVPNDGKAYMHHIMHSVNGSRGHITSLRVFHIVLFTHYL